MLLVDTGPVVAMADRGDRMREAARGVITGEKGPLVIPAPATAEVDYLLRRRIGDDAGKAFLDDLAAGRFEVESLSASEYAKAVELRRGYADLDLSLADLSLVVLAERFDCTRIATFDERHFRAIRPLQGGSFTLLPADAG